MLVQYLKHRFQYETQPCFLIEVPLLRQQTHSVDLRIQMQGRREVHSTARLSSHHVQLLRFCLAYAHQVFPTSSMPQPCRYALNLTALNEL